MEGDEEKTEALAGRHFHWEEGGRPLKEKEEEREGPGYSVQELVEKLKKALQRTSNTSDPGPDTSATLFICILCVRYDAVNVSKATRASCQVFL